MTASEEIVKILRRNRTPAYLRRQLGQTIQQVQALQLVGGGDPALAPIGTELAAYSTEFNGPLSGWGWLNQGTSTGSIALSRAMLVPEAGGVGTNALRGFAPDSFLAPPWTVRIRLLNWCTRVGDGGGLFAMASSGRVHAIQAYRRLAANVDPFTEVWAVNDYALITSALPNATRWGPITQDIRSLDRLFQIRCDGTSLYFDFSPDNAQFINIQSTTLATYLLSAPTRVGVFANCPNGAPTVGSIGYEFFRVYNNSDLNQVVYV